MPQEKTPKVVRKIAMALGPELGILRANRTGAKPPGGGPSCKTGMSLTLAIPGLFLMYASVIFFLRRFLLKEFAVFSPKCDCKGNGERTAAIFSTVMFLPDFYDFESAALCTSAFSGRLAPLCTKCKLFLFIVTQIRHTK